MIDILRKSIKAERTGDFLLHLETVREMLPFLAATGHNNYTKAAWIYHQQMTQLKTTNLALYTQFLAGNHVVRRTEGPFVGISTDLAIEQVLMRSIKSSGGLTRGKGLGEDKRLIWLMCMPACAEIHKVMQDITGVSMESTEQHVQHTDQSPARQKRDEKDIKAILRFLVNRNPFANLEAGLRSISSGRIASNEVNAEKAETVGEKILHNMIRKNLQQVKFKRDDQVTTMRMISKSGKEKALTQFDSTLLFQRLIRIADHSPGSLEIAFSFELCGVPASLFDTGGLPRHTNKSSLAKNIWNEANQTNADIPSVELAYVFDGGSLLHQVPWSKGQKYSQLAQSYVDYIVRKCKGQDCTVVFDGYKEALSTKDAAHLRRTKQCVSSPDISFDADMLVTEAKDRFLSNQTNKQRLIDFLVELLSQNGIRTEKAVSDADRLIAKVALEKAKTGHTLVVGEDTDILILLLFHLQPRYWPVYFGNAKSGTNTAKLWDIQMVQDELGNYLCQHLLFVHAISGCDTTSALYGLGKAVFIKKAKKSASFREHAQKFLSTDGDKNVLEKAGEKVLVEVYGGKEKDTLNKLRYIKYNQKLTTSTKAFQPCSLPPTSSAAKLHIQRTCFQVQEWMQSDQDKIDLNPLN